MRRIPESIGSNPGLALSRYVPWEPNGSKSETRRKEFFTEAAKMTADIAYEDAFRRWKEALMVGRVAVCATAVLGGPLAVGLGNQSPSEVGLTLHRIYGMPVIPGSALKGACKRTANNQQGSQAIYGSMESSGGVIFHDAWYDPGSQRGPLAPDTVTVHHPGYYQSQNNRPWPTDFDDPIPIPFISVPAGAKFFFAIDIAGADNDWRTFVEEMLKATLTETGLGGKTNAGYGWFTENIIIERPKSLDELYAGPLREVQKLTASSFGGVKAILDSVDSIDGKRYIANEMKKKIDVDLRRWNKDSESKPWRLAIEDALK